MTFTTRNPATGEDIQTYPTWTDRAIHQALEQAQRTFVAWSGMSFERRASYLHDIADRLVASMSQCATLISNEMGKPRKDALAEVQKCIDSCHYYATHAPSILAKRQVDNSAQTSSFVTYQPLGAVFGIMPWNYPFWQVFRFVVPTLMAGNVALLSHAPSVLGCAQLIEDLLLDVGLPLGVFQNLVIEDEKAAMVIAHDAVKAVTLTGSVRAGSAVAALAGQAVKKVVLELGGSDPYVVCDDADLEKAAKCIVTSRLSNTGQVCIAAKRVIASDETLAALEPLLLENMQAYQPGDPHQLACKMGPMARADLRDNVHQQVQASIAQGAQCVCGGEPVAGPGFYYPPTLLKQVTPGMPAFDQEVFGPVVALISAEDEDHAIELANQTPFGLGAAVFTQDLARGEKIAAEQLQAGVCFVNDMVSSKLHLPFGGIKHSGIGRELGDEGIRSFVNVKTVVIKRA